MNVPSYNALLDRKKLIRTVQELAEQVNTNNSSSSGSGSGSGSSGSSEDLQQAVNTCIADRISNSQNYNLDLYPLTPGSLGNAGKWYLPAAGITWHRAIPVTPGSTVYIKAGTSNNTSGVFYGFVTSSYTGSYANNAAIPYVSGGERLNVADNTTTTVTIPADAAYLIICDRDGSGQKYYEVSYKKDPTSVNSSALALDADISNSINGIGKGFKIRVCTWNIGCFASGSGGNSTITHSDYDDYSLTWRTIINALKADILCMSEFNPTFVNASGNNEAIESRNTIFSNYPYASVGTKTGQLCEAIMSHYQLSKSGFVTYTPNVNNRYYAVSTIMIGSIPVKIAVTHLDYQQNATGATNREKEITELIKDLGVCDHVIICGDFNVASYSELTPFVNAGFHLVNCGYLGALTTYEGDGFQVYLDNIIVKGFSISDIQVYGINKSDIFPNATVATDYAITDHHPLAATLTLL